MSGAAALTCALVCWAELASAQVGVVTTLADSGPGSLREAIATAPSGATITFAVTGAIVRSYSNGPLTIDKNLTISGPGAFNLAISGNYFQTVLYVVSGVTVNISGVTIANGSTVGDGGGIFNQGTLTLSNSIVSSNRADGYGGGIINFGGTLTLTNSTVSDNFSGVDGGLGGGGIANDNGGTVTLNNSTVSTNAAVGFVVMERNGGGILNGGTMTLNHSTVSGNCAAEGCDGNGGGGGNGGGIFNIGTLTLTNSTVSGNTAGTSGGGIANVGVLFVNNSTVSGNSAHESGGGLYSGVASTVKNTIVANNARGGNCFASGNVISDGHNLADDNSCASFFTAIGDLNNVPAGLDPNGLQNNGGPTRTIALLATSAAVDRIPVDDCTTVGGVAVSTDQRGVSRPQGPACDIGAYERGGAATGVPPTRVQTSGWQLITADGGQTFTVTLNNVGTGHLLILSVAHKYPNRKVAIPTDDRGNTWQVADEVQNSLTGEWHQVFYVKSAAGGSTTMRTVLPFGLWGSAWLLATEVSGQNPTAPLNAHTTFADTTGSTAHRAAATAIALGSDVYVYVSGHLGAWANTVHPGVGFVEIDNQDVIGDGSWELEAQDRSGGGPSTSDGQWSSDVPRTATSVMVSFLPADGGTKQSQTITFGPLPAKTYGDSPFTASAIASSGLAVSFVAVGNCQVAGTMVTITGAGSCTITASQAGDASYLPALDVSQTFSIAKANQTIAFAAIPNKTTSDPPFQVTATASSGLPVSFVASGPCTVSADMVTITGAGGCTVTASQIGSANYNPAPNVEQTFTITTGQGTIPPTRVQTTGWQHITPDGGQTFTVTLDNVGAGHLLILSVAHKYPNRKVAIPTDDRGNTWQVADEVQNSLTGEWHQVFYVKTAAAGSTTVRTVLSFGLWGSAWLLATEVSGQNPTAPLNVHTTFADTTGSTAHRAAATAIALGSDVYVYVSGHLGAWANTIHPGVGFVEIDDQDVIGDGSWELEAQDGSAAGPSTSDGQWSSDVPRTATSVMVSFLPR